jgi:hypothetical protein
LKRYKLLLLIKKFKENILLGKFVWPFFAVYEKEGTLKIEVIKQKRSAILFSRKKRKSFTKNGIKKSITRTKFKLFSS